MIKPKGIAIKKQLPMIIAFAVLLVLVVLIAVMDLGAPIDYTMYTSGSIFYEKGTVTAVLSEQTEPALGMPGWMLGSQEIRVLIKSGEEKGKEIELRNDLSTTHNVRVQKGQSVIVKADRPEGVTPYYTLYNYDRTPGLYAAGVVFILFMALVGRFKGLKSVAGLLISLYFIVAFLLPMIYRGYSPVFMASLTVIVISAFSLLLLNGFSQKTLTAFASTAAGVVSAALAFLLLSALLHLTGYNVSEAEDLIVVSQNTGLQIGQVLFAAILISSLGAVMDITVSTAAALYEMKEIKPSMTSHDLFRSGMSIGRDMIGGMSMTLILAFVGSSLPVLLVLISYGTQFAQLINSDYIAIEVVQALAGSLAVILSVPITSGLCAFIASRKQKRIE